MGLIKYSSFQVQAMPKEFWNEHLPKMQAYMASHFEKHGHLPSPVDLDEDITGGARVLAGDRRGHVCRNGARQKQRFAAHVLVGVLRKGLPFTKQFPKHLGGVLHTGSRVCHTLANIYKQARSQGTQYFIGVIHLYQTTFLYYLCNM